MKKLFLFSMMLFMLAFMSCTKQENVVGPVATKTGKLLLPDVSIVQGSELITKSGNVNSITNLTYEFWVKNGSTWVLAGDELFKDGTTSQSGHHSSFDVNFPHNCTSNAQEEHCVTEVPLGIQTRIVVTAWTGSNTNKVVKYYGIYETPNTGFVFTTSNNISTITSFVIKLYEIDSRLKIDVSDLASNTNFNFYLTFNGNIRDVNYADIVTTSLPSWIFTTTSGTRNFQGVPLKLTPATAFTTVFSVLGSGQSHHESDYKIKINNGSDVTAVKTGNYFSIFELFGQGANNFTVSYIIKRKGNNDIFKSGTITLTTPTTNGFVPSNWLQPGYNFTVTFLSDPQDLGRGCFTSDLVENDNISGTVTL